MKDLTMYLAYANDGPMTVREDRYLIAVVLDDDVFANLRKIKAVVGELKFPYHAMHCFTFPIEKARLICETDLDDCVKDCRVIPDWARGGEDPLEYYRFIVGAYKPTDDFEYAKKPDSVHLMYHDRNSFGFNAYHDGVMYHGYSFEWPEF